MLDASVKTGVRAQRPAKRVFIAEECVLGLRRLVRTRWLNGEHSLQGACWRAWYTFRTNSASPRCFLASPLDVVHSKCRWQRRSKRGAVGGDTATVRQTTGPNSLAPSDSSLR